MPKRLLCSSKPVMVVTALVAVLGITGTAYGAKLITGLDIKDGSITIVDLSKGTQNSLQGDKGAKGAKGNLGATGALVHAATPAMPVRKATQATRVILARPALPRRSPVPAARLAPPARLVAAGATGTTGPTGATGAAGAAGAAGAGANEGDPCTVPGPLTGHIHWSFVSGTTWTITCTGAV